MAKISTSGIGLAYARALAKEGADVMINGFGDPKAIEEERARIESEFKVKCVYNGADMAKGDEVEAMIADAADEIGKVGLGVHTIELAALDQGEEDRGALTAAVLAAKAEAATSGVRATRAG